MGLVEFPAFFWRLQNWDLDLPPAVLFLFIIAPCSLRHAISPSREPTWQSNLVGWTLALYIVGWTLALYIALMYFLAGIAKLVFSYWWVTEVKLGNNWRTQLLDAAEYSPLSAITAEPASAFLISYPTVATTIATIVLIDQLILPLALISRHVRLFGPPIIFANHFGVVTSLGIFFSSMPFLGPGIFISWSRLFPGARTGPRSPTDDSSGFLTPKRKVLTALACALSVFLDLLPAAANTIYHPFANNMTFGWRYKNHEEYESPIVLGYLDKYTGDYAPMPRGYGGFPESRQNSLMNAFAAEVLKKPSIFRLSQPSFAPRARATATGRY
jgi:hypothetical protein